MEHIYRGWSLSAIECYKLGCQCNLCRYPYILETKCEMKKAVLQLVRIYGKPTEELERILRKNEGQV